MFCKVCGTEINDKAVICLKCGCNTVNIKLSDNKIAYILLGVLGGVILPGLHNIYIKQTNKGLFQLLGTVCTCWVLWVVMYIWTIYDVVIYCKRND